MTTGRSVRDVCLGVLDAAEAHDYGSGYGSPGMVYIAYPQAAKLADDLLAALAEAGYVVVRAEDEATIEVGARAYWDHNRYVGVEPEWPLLLASDPAEAEVYRAPVRVILAALAASASKAGGDQ